MNELKRMLVALFVPLTLGASLAAQERAPALDPSVRRSIADSVAALVEHNYVVSDTGRMIAEHVRAQTRAGAYEKASTLPELAQALTADLQAINHDRHLNVTFDPALTARWSGSDAEPNEAEAARLKRELDERARRNNYGFERVEVLTGNIGHLKLGGPISGSPEAFEAAEQALRFLARTDAVLLDLRGVPGGSAEMANFLISHFTEADVSSLRIYYRSRDATVVRRTLSEVPGPRRSGVPLYVLVDGRSASAAEDIPFVLQNLGRATIVGKTTRGAGRNNRYYPAGHGLAVSVSVTRVMEPETGREWEQVGVIPDVQVPSEEALAAAHLHALERIARAEGDEGRKAELALLREYAEARYRPATLSADHLAAYAGVYEGGAEVIVKEGELHFRPGAAMPLIRLDALSKMRFSFGPTRRVSFTEDAAGRMQMEVVVDGRPAGVFSRID